MVGLATTVLLSGGVAEVVCAGTVEAQPGSRGDKSGAQGNRGSGLLRLLQIGTWACATTCWPSGSPTGRSQSTKRPFRRHFRLLACRG